MPSINVERISIILRHQLSPIYLGLQHLITQDTHSSDCKEEECLRKVEWGTIFIFHVNQGKLRLSIVQIVATLGWEPTAPQVPCDFSPPSSTHLIRYKACF